MNAKLICYTLGKITPTQRSAFKRKMNGFIDISNNGGYKYKREGLLQTIPHFAPIRSVIIVLKKDAEKILQILNEYKAKYYWFDVDMPENKLSF